MERSTKQFIIRGQVQGVGYRYFAKKNADSLGVVGFAQNLSDGTVKVIAQAPQDEILVQFQSRLKQGPMMARVDAVNSENIQITNTMTGFGIR